MALMEKGVAGYFHTKPEALTRVITKLMLS